jgi:hypothetical protein
MAGNEGSKTQTLTMMEIVSEKKRKRERKALIKEKGEKKKKATTKHS